MAQQTMLDGSARRIEIAPGGYGLQAPGLVGSVVEMDSQERATRADQGLVEDRLMAALRATEIETTRIFELTVGPSLGAPPAAATTRAQESAIILTTPDLGATVDQVVLHTDEAGVSRWIWPEPRTTGTAGATRAGGGEIVFHLPLTGAPAPAAGDTATTRGPLSQLGRRLVRVLVWATDPFIGLGALGVASRWEAEKRQYGLHPLPWLDADRPVRWERYAGKRGLILIHGTFSCVEGTFGRLYPPLQQLLTSRYEDRLCAFNHPSLHHDPTQNVDELISFFPPNQAIELDLICHSRGGLVSRELIRRLSGPLPGGRRVTIRRAVFVASPHAGTILTDGDHMIDMLDRYTNLLTELPDDAFSLTIEGVLIVVKLIAHGALTGLPGLRSMRPGGEYLGGLNQGLPPTTEYYAVAANFQPTGTTMLERFGRKAGNDVIDTIFGEENDGVVPTRGSYAAVSGAPGFPIPPGRRLIYTGADQIHHCNYFVDDRFVQTLAQWLT